ncbi:MAG TPA: tetratricopeptide repeat protein [Ramlibacter sp.]|nr:tetratricopeptide repeat protein [Ramlibacter sp.]
MKFQAVTPTMQAHRSTPPFDFSHHTKVIVVLDVVESVRIMEDDEHGFVQRWHNLVEQTRQLLPGYGGRIHKSLGDGLMLEFDGAPEATQASLALLELCRTANVGRPPEVQMHLRLGAHLARYVADQYDIYGTDVNLTARVATLAGPGELVVTADLRDRLTAGLDASIEDLGDCHLKHVKKPVRVYRVGPPGAAPVVERSQQAMDLRPTIAVIPFAMRSGEIGHEMLGEALADELIAALSRTLELHVISRLSTTVFRERNATVEDMRAHLGANYILSGSCRTAGERIQLFTELIDAKNGRVVWADTFKGEVRGVFAEDDTLVAELVAKVSSSVVSNEMERARSHALPTLEGYTLLLGAVALMHRTQFSEFDRARSMFEALIERSRRHPVPHAWLAKWHVLRAQQGWTDNPQVEARLALDCIKRALDNDPNCVLAWTVDGFIHTNLMRDLEGANWRYEKALSLNPNESLAWLLKGTLHAFKGEGQDAMASTERALLLSPLDPLRYFYDSLAGTAAASAGAYDRAIELCQRSLRSNRTHTSTYRALAIAQARSGRTQDARKTVAEMLKLDPGFTLRGFSERSPTSQFSHGQELVDALRKAGVPE